MFYFISALIFLSLFTLPIIALIDTLFSKDDGLTDYQRSASLLDRK